jgi:acetyltransferase-like isoleucine patch superfamily enzyme
MPPLAILRRVRAFIGRTRCWLLLRPRVTGRLKLRGAVHRIRIDPSFRCDGDLWLGVHADDGFIDIAAGVSASGPLVITAVRPLRIGKEVLFGPNVLVTDHYHGDVRNANHLSLPPSLRPLHSPGEIAIGAQAQLGANCVVLSPTDIGSGAVIAANAVVKGLVEARTIYTGLISSRPRDQRLDTIPGD